MPELGPGVTEMRNIINGMSEEVKAAWKDVEAPARRLDPWNANDFYAIEKCHEDGHPLMNLKITPLPPPTGDGFGEI